MEINVRLGTSYRDMSVSHGTLQEDDIFDAVKQFLPSKLKSTYSNLPQSDRTEYLYETIFSELNAIAPKGYYFGSHEGNSSDLGFWRHHNDC